MTHATRPHFTYLGHSTVRCDLPGGEVILIDPWVNNPVCPEEVKSFDRIDVMLITHGHFDHMADAVELAKVHRPVVVSTYEICVWMERQGVEKTSPMNIGGTQVVHDVHITQVQAIHTSTIDDGERLIYGGPATGFVVRLADGYTFYHAGDTDVFTDMQLIADLYQPQLAFLPIGDRFTMGPQQAALACKFLQIQQVVPIHWGTFPQLTGTPDMLDQELRNRDASCEIIALQPGEIY